MRIGIVTPAPPRSRHGNRVTALRWARILTRLGHRVAVSQTYRGGGPYDVLIGLHARRSSPSVRRFHHDHPERPVVVGLTGTDLYRDLPGSPAAQRSLEIATRLVVLQPRALERLPRAARGKARVIRQSAAAAPRGTDRGGGSPGGRFDVCVVGHLRAVKDPFRAALAARLLPKRSRVQILHLGAAMTAAMRARAQAEMRDNPRYRWLGEQPQAMVRRCLRRSGALVLSSRLEGGANVLSEAIVSGTPVLATRIPGTVGILGPGYPGYFRTGDTKRLARLLLRAEEHPAFLRALTSWCRGLAPRFHPREEQRAWRRLLGELK